MCVGQRSLKRDAGPSRKGRWALRVLPAPPAGGQAPWWRAGTVALPSSSLAARGAQGDGWDAKPLR